MREQPRPTPSTVEHLLLTLREHIDEFFGDDEYAVRLLDNILTEVQKQLKALVQARGALILDHMVDDNGEPFGTTKVALEAIDAALAACKPRTPATPFPPDGESANAGVMKPPESETVSRLQARPSLVVRARPIFRLGPRVEARAANRIRRAGRGETC